MILTGIQFHCADEDLSPHELLNENKKIICEISLGTQKTYKYCFLYTSTENASFPFVQFLCRRWVELIFSGRITTWYP